MIARLFCPFLALVLGAACQGPAYTGETGEDRRPSLLVARDREAGLDAIDEQSGIALDADTLSFELISASRPDEAPNEPGLVTSHRATALQRAELRKVADPSAERP